jgi:serine/threonine-protein kinase RsbW
MSNECNWIWRIERVIPSSLGAFQPTIDDVLQQLRSQSWAQHEIFSVHLALEEALANAIKHGNRLDASKQVHVDCKVSPERLWVKIRDEGPGFILAQIPDCTDDDRLLVPSGRGLMLMRAYMSRVEFNAQGNCVVMEKHRNGYAD